MNCAPLPQPPPPFYPLDRTGRRDGRVVCTWRGLRRYTTRWPGTTHERVLRGGVGGRDGAAIPLANELMAFLENNPRDVYTRTSKPPHPQPPSPFLRFFLPPRGHVGRRTRVRLTGVCTLFIIIFIIFFIPYCKVVREKRSSCFECDRDGCVS